MSRTIFYGPKGVRAIEVRLYLGLIKNSNLFCIFWKVILRFFSFSLFFLIYLFIYLFIIIIIIIIIFSFLKINNWKKYM